MVFSLFFFLSYFFKLNVMCHSPCRKKFCLWVSAVPYDFHSPECSWWSPAEESVESWVCKHFLSGWDGHCSFQISFLEPWSQALCRLHWLLRLRFQVNTLWQLWLPGTWNLQCFTAVGGVLVVCLIARCFCGPQEFLFFKWGSSALVSPVSTGVDGQEAAANITAVELPSECQFVLPSSLGPALYLVPDIAAVQWRLCAFPTETTSWPHWLF